jgi:cytochrome c peroxidase
MIVSKFFLPLLVLTLTSCGDGSYSPSSIPGAPATIPDPLDIELTSIIADLNLSGDPSIGRNLPLITDPIPSLGRLLFFSKNLGGEFDSACVSCHHPVLGGGDGLSLPVGVHGVDAMNVSDPDLLGVGRHAEVAGGLPRVSRNSPSIFNAGLRDRGLFLDSRVSSLAGQLLSNGTAGPIVTPESPEFGIADSTIPAGTTLPAAQARFPVVSRGEMLADFLPAANNQSVRATLAARLDFDGSAWPALFDQAFGDPEITFDRIATAIGEYERSMVFLESPWKRYIEGDLTALTSGAKEGAISFFTPIDDGGAGCSRCHSGDSFSDEGHHATGFPQLFDDFGRGGANGQDADRYHFHTPTLLNVAATSPYGHAGIYQTLEEVVRHYNDPEIAVKDLFGEENSVPFADIEVPFCNLAQVQRLADASGQDCSDLYPDAYNNSILSIARLTSGEARSPLGPGSGLNEGGIMSMVEFLQALSDPCVEDRVCLDPWIVDADDVGDYPDDSALVAHDEQKLDL